MMLWLAVLGIVFCAFAWNRFSATPTQILDRSTSETATDDPGTVSTATPPVEQPTDVNVPTPASVLNSAMLSRTWIETDVVDPDGYVGIQIHAVIDTAGASGLRFAAHFQDANANPVRAIDPRYRDANGEASVAVPIPASRTPSEIDASVRVGKLGYEHVFARNGSPSEIAAFIPASALNITGDAQLILLPGVFDASNVLVAKGQPVSFAMHVGKMQITRVRMESDRHWNATLTLKVSFRLLNSQAPMDAMVVARFKDARGLPLPGRPPYANTAGELTVTSRFRIPSSWDGEVMEDLPVTIPPGLIPAGSTAEVAIYDAQAGTYLTQAVAVPVP